MLDLLFDNDSFLFYFEILGLISKRISMSILRKKIHLIGVVLAMFFVVSCTQQSQYKLSCDVADQSTSSILAITWHPFLQKITCYLSVSPK